MAKYLDLNGLETVWGKVTDKITESKADWNLNDETADDYVKNRTHWEETTSILPESIIEIQSTYYGQVDNFSMPIMIGYTYDVIYDGKTYAVTASYDNYGRPALLTESFQLISTSTYSGKFYSVGGSLTPTISVSIDIEGTLTTILPETTLQLLLTGRIGTIPLSLADKIIAGNTYVVYYNDVAYYITALNYLTYISLNEDLFSITVDSTSSTISVSEDVSSIKLAIASSIVHLLDSKFINTDVITQEIQKLHIQNGRNRGLRQVTSTEEGTDYSLGEGAIALGINTKATKEGCFASGSSTTASGIYSHAEGHDTTASGAYSHAEGYSTEATSYYSHAEGYNTLAGGLSSHAEGLDTIASGYDSHAEGYECKAMASYSHAEGRNTTAINEAAHAEGYNTIAKGVQSHAEGSNTVAYGSYSHTEGYGYKGSITISGSGTSYTISGGSVQAGDVIVYNDIYSKIISVSGSNITVSTTLASTQITNKSAYLIRGIAYDSYSHSEGNCTIASGSTSHAEGQVTIASGAVSHAEGSNTIASGLVSHAEGYGTMAKGAYSHAEGYIGGFTSVTLSGLGTSYTISIDSAQTGNVIVYNDIYSTIRSVSGRNITVSTTLSSTQITNLSAKLIRGIAYGDYSHSEGNGTTASGPASHAEGTYTVASNSYSHAEGGGTTASGEYSHAEGMYTIASGNWSHAEGAGTTASGLDSHAEGGGTIAFGYSSHAEGAGTIASSDYLHVQGQGNIEDALNKYAHIVGNGTDTSNRSNAHTLDWSGNAWFQGSVYVGGTGQDDAAAIKILPAKLVSTETTPTTNDTIYWLYE